MHYFCVNCSKLNEPHHTVFPATICDTVSWNSCRVRPHLFLTSPPAWIQRAGCPANTTLEAWPSAHAHWYKLRRVSEHNNADWLELNDAPDHLNADWLEWARGLRAPENKLERVMLESPRDSTVTANRAGGSESWSYRLRRTARLF